MDSDTPVPPLRFRVAHCRSCFAKKAPFQYGTLVADKLTMLRNSSDAPGRVCTDASCSNDSQCSPGQVCRKDPSIRIGELDPNGIVCTTPCTSDHECAPTDTCDDSGHCRARNCSECPSYYSCASGTCTIPSCSNDSDCPGGYCVSKSSGSGICAGSLGSCRTWCF